MSRSRSKSRSRPLAHAGKFCFAPGSNRLGPSGKTGGRATVRYFKSRRESSFKGGFMLMRLAGVAVIIACALMAATVQILFRMMRLI